MLVPAVLFGVDFRSVGHETAGVQCVRMCEECIVGRLRVIAKAVALRCEFVKVGCGPVILRRVEMVLDGWVSCHGILLLGYCQLQRPVTFEFGRQGPALRPNG